MRVGFVLVSVALASSSVSLARAQGICDPACRSGFLCHDGTCISGCNPACAPGEKCTGTDTFECVSETAPTAAPAPAPAPPVAQTAPAGEPEPGPAPSASAASPTASPATAPAPGNRGLIGGGGISVPDAASAGALQGGFVMPSADDKNDSRLLAVLYFVSTEDTDTTGVFAAGQFLLWPGAGTYGLGVGGGFGYAKFSANTKYGWDDDSFSAGAYLVPVALRFGSRHNFELALSAGAMSFFSRDVRPWGYIAFNFLPGG